MLHTKLLQGEDNRRAIFRTLEDLPTILCDIYDQAMLRIEDQRPSQVKRAKQVLSWIIYAERPLTVKELQCALAVEPGDTSLDEDALPDRDLMVSVCAGLVAIEQKNETIGLVHHTTYEYFERVRENQFFHAQRDIVETCLTYLSFDCFTGAVSDYSHALLEALMGKNVLLNYAAQYWGDHARKGWNRSPMISDLARKFLGLRANLLCSYHITRHCQRSIYAIPSLQSLRQVDDLQIAASFGLEELANSILNSQGGLDVSNIDASRTNDETTALHHAVVKGHVGIIELLLARGADHNTKNRMILEQKTALYWAGATGRETVVQLLLRTNPEDLRSALMGATSKGHVSLIQALLQQAAGEISLCEMLKYAIRYRQEAVVRLILERWIKVPPKDIASALIQLAHGAIDREHNLTIAQLLLECNANYETPSLEYGLTPLMISAKNGYSDMVRLLLRYNASVSVRDSRKGRRPLQWAVLKGHEDVVHLLLEREADSVSLRKGWLALTKLYRLSRDEDETTLQQMQLDIATFGSDGFSTIVQQIQSDSAILGSNDFSDTLLVHGPAERGQQSVASLLLDLGADINAKSPRGDTALHKAIRYREQAVVDDLQKDLIRFLLRKGSSLTAEDRWQVQPLIQALIRPYFDEGLVRLLLEEGAAIDAQPGYPTPAIVLAVRYQREALIPLLVEFGANTEARDINGETALLAAVDRRSQDLLESLLENGADINAKDRDGGTPLVRAVRRGFCDIVRLLLEKGANPNVTQAATILEDGDSPTVSEDDFNTALGLVSQAQQVQSSHNDSVTSTS